MEYLIGTILGRLIDPFLIVVIILLVWIAGFFNSWKIVFLVCFSGSTVFALSTTTSSYALELYVFTCAIQSGIAAFIWNRRQKKKIHVEKIEPELSSQMDNSSPNNNSNERVLPSIGTANSLQTQNNHKSEDIYTANQMNLEDALDISSDFSELNENCKAYTYYDEKILPWPKTLIYKALSRILKESPDTEISNACYKLTFDLGYFQPNIGMEPLTLTGNSDIVDAILTSKKTDQEKAELLNRHLSNQQNNIEERYNFFESLRKHDRNLWLDYGITVPNEVKSQSNVVPFKPRQ